MDWTRLRFPLWSGQPAIPVEVDAKGVKGRLRCALLTHVGEHESTGVTRYTYLTTEEYDALPVALYQRVSALEACYAMLSLRLLGERPVVYTEIVGEQARVVVLPAPEGRSALAAPWEFLLYGVYRRLPQGYYRQERVIT